MQFIGFFRQLTNGNADVHKNDIPPPGSGMNYPRVEVSQYLRFGYPVLDVMELTTDMIGDSFRVPGGSSVLTDGSHVWRLDLASYVQYHCIHLPQEFLDFIRDHRYRIPTVKQETLVEISVAVNRKLNCRTDPAAGPRFERDTTAMTRPVTSANLQDGRPSIQGRCSSNNPSERGSPSAGSRDIARASLDELEALVARPDHVGDDWQSWEMLRDLSVGRMRNEDLGTDTQLRWAGLALAANRLKRNSGGVDPAQALADEVYVRLFAVQEFGPAHGDPIRDPAETCRVAFREIGESLDEVVTAAEAWKSLPRQRILRLRRIKNLLTLLSPIKYFIECEAPERKQLSEWLQIVPRLP
ncbi:hypothetical protein ACPCAG_12245 [Streptomyces pseudogriseolus]|uniref:hypothetical protein n=1 Tax=Streptomyces pseudogriseolus TaxID=36817 RepID=UPI003FA2653E